jgi:putative nucleotidyltransferase-like protein
MGHGDRGGPLSWGAPVRGREVASALTHSWRAAPTAWEPSRARLAEVQPLLLASGAGALAWRRLRLSEAARSPAGFELQQAYRLHAIESLLHERQLARVLVRLHGAGVEPLLGRGWAAAGHYPESGLRPYRNFDLYVGAAQAAAARAALDGEQAPVVVNVGCAELDDRAWSLLNERAQSVPLGNGQVRVLGPEDHLRLLALQMFGRGACRPLWLCDVAAIVETAGDLFEWRHFLSGDRRRTEWVCCALVLARELLGADLARVPVSVTARILPHWLVNTTLRQWSARDLLDRPRRAEPAASRFPRPQEALRALRARWPNAIEATVGVRGPFNAIPRLPFQLAECVSRTARFTLRRAGPRAL